MTDNGYDIGMDAASTLRDARHRAGLSQRDLARRTGMAQPAIARIERGRVTPGIDTLSRLLHECGFDLSLEPKAGEGIDRSVIRQLLRLTPLQRLELAVTEANNVSRLLELRR